MTQVLFRIPKELHQRFKIAAATLGKPMSQLLGEMITEFLREKGNLNN